MIYLLKVYLFLALISPAKAESGKVIRLCDNNVAKIFISPRGTALDFPTEPQDVVLGAKGLFSIKYIRNDLTISPTTLNSRSNLFVYLQGRRFVLDLTTSANGATLYFIKDCMEEKIKVKMNGK